MNESSSQAFTRTDLVAVVAAIGLLAVLFVRAQEEPDARARSERIRCVSNLKQVGLGFHLWSNDNRDKFPMRVRARQGGSFEAIARGETFRHFAVMSNELNHARVLVCPSDDREPAPRFAELSNTNLSYFVGLDAEEMWPQTILSGDRNVTNGLPRSSGILSLEPDRPAGWTAEIHVEKGNIGLADGSVHQMNTAALRRQGANSFGEFSPRSRRRGSAGGDRGLRSVALFGSRPISPKHRPPSRRRLSFARNLCPRPSGR